MIDSLVGPTCDRCPPAAGVVIKELHLDHGVHIVPLCKDNEAQPLLLHIHLQLADLLRIELLLTVHNQQGSILQDTHTDSDRLSPLAGGIIVPICLQLADLLGLELLLTVNNQQGSMLQDKHIFRQTVTTSNCKHLANLSSAC